MGTRPKSSGATTATDQTFVGSRAAVAEKGMIEVAKEGGADEDEDDEGNGDDEGVAWRAPARRRLLN